MKRYLQQLISDMHEAIHRVPDENLSNMLGDDEIDEDEQFPHSEKHLFSHRRKIADIVGIPSISLPPAQKLSDEQTETLSNEMESLLLAYYFYPEFPENLPGRLKYIQLVKIWDDEYPFLTNGNNHLEFCDYDQSNCPFPDYCDICSQIKKYKAKSEDFSDMKYKPELNSNQANEDDLYETFEFFKPNLSCRFIPSIYNYCDRWCERCNFNKQCRLYDNEKRLLATHETRQADKEEFLDNISQILERTKFFLDKEIKKRGLEMKNMDNDAYELKQEKIKEHPLVKWSEKYSLMVSQWFHDHQDDLKQKLKTDPNAEKHQSLFSHMEVIHWDHTMITAKISRAINGLIEQDDAEELDDANGSAKVALVLADRSVIAWKNILDTFYERETGITQIANQLKKLRMDILKNFPDAPNFKRPGFDD